MVLRRSPLWRPGMLLCFFLAFLGFCFSIMARQAAPKGTAVPTDSVQKTLPVDSVMKAFKAKTVSLINERCAGCHGGKHPRMGLSLEPGMLVEAVKDIPSRQIDSLKLVDTRRPERSYFLMKVRGDKGIKGSRMPDNAPAFSADEIRMIDRWIHGISGFRHGPKPAHSAQDSTRKR